jgi:hypothetical protein
MTRSGWSTRQAGRRRVPADDSMSGLSAETAPDNNFGHRADNFRIDHGKCKRQWTDLGAPRDLFP